MGGSSAGLSTVQPSAPRRRSASSRSAGALEALAGEGDEISAASLEVRVAVACGGEPERFGDAHEEARGHQRGGGLHGEIAEDGVPHSAPLEVAHAAGPLAGDAGKSRETDGVDFAAIGFRACLR